MGINLRHRAAELRQSHLRAQRLRAVLQKRDVQPAEQGCSDAQSRSPLGTRRQRPNKRRRHRQPSPGREQHPHHRQQRQRQGSL